MILVNSGSLLGLTSHTSTKEMSLLVPDQVRDIGQSSIKSFAIDEVISPIVSHNPDHDFSLDIAYRDQSKLQESKNENTWNFDVNCASNLALGFVGSLISGNPIWLRFSTLSCITKANSQIVNGTIPNQVFGVELDNTLSINLINLWGEPLTFFSIEQSDGSVLPKWLNSGLLYQAALPLQMYKQSAW